MLMKLTPGAQCYKTFCGRNLRIFIISYGVCPRQASPAYSIKRSSLVRKSVSHGQKKIYNIGPRVNGHQTTYELFTIILIVRPGTERLSPSLIFWATLYSKID